MHIILIIYRSIHTHTSISLSISLSVDLLFPPIQTHLVPAAQLFDLVDEHDRVMYIRIYAYTISNIDLYRSIYRSI